MFDMSVRGSSFVLLATRTVDPKNREDNEISSASRRPDQGRNVIQQNSERRLEYSMAVRSVSRKERRNLFTVFYSCSYSHEQFTKQRIRI